MHSKAIEQTWLSYPMAAAYSPDLKHIKKKWAQVKFLRQGWMQNDLSKLVYDTCPRHNNFILNRLSHESHSAII